MHKSMVVLSCAPVLRPENVSSLQTVHQSAGLNAATVRAIDIGCLAQEQPVKLLMSCRCFTPVVFLTACLLASPGSAWLGRFSKPVFNNCYGFATAADQSRTSEVGRSSSRLGVSGGWKRLMFRGLCSGIPLVVFYEVWRVQEADDRCWDFLEAESDECLTHCGSGRLRMRHPTRSGGLQILRC